MNKIKSHKCNQQHNAKSQ